MGGNGSSVNLQLQGIYGGNVTTGNVMTYTFPSDGRIGRTVTGTASQSGNQIQIDFTNGCNMGTNPGARIGVDDLVIVPSNSAYNTSAPALQKIQYNVRKKRQDNQIVDLTATDLSGCTITWKVWYGLINNNTSYAPGTPNYNELTQNTTSIDIRWENKKLNDNKAEGLIIVEFYGTACSLPSATKEKIVPIRYLGAPGNIRVVAALIHS